MPHSASKIDSALEFAGARSRSRILVCCDDRFHPGADVRAGLAPLLLSTDCEVEWLDGREISEATDLRRYKVVLLAKANVLSRADPRPWLKPEDVSFLEYVHEGGGLLVVHAGLAGHAQVPAMRAVTGGAFVHHPPPCEVAVEPQPGHAITAGVDAAFPIFDEHYFAEVDVPATDVFMTTRSVHGEQPAGWTRLEGAGRVCALSPGHFKEVWLHPAYQRLLRNALQWLGCEAVSP